MLETEYSGDGPNALIGVIDGVNCTFRVHFPMNLDFTVVLLNGTPISPTVDNGWVIVDAYTIAFKEPPAVVDNVAVQYVTGDSVGGGNPGGPDGTPQIVQAVELRPTMLASASDDRPSMTASCVCPCQPK